MTNAKGFARFFISGEKSTHFIVGGIADILHRVVMASREIVDFEGKNRQKVVDIAANAPDAAFFPRPDFGRNVVENGTGGMRFHPFRDFQIETGIIHQHHTMGLPRFDGVFAVAKGAQNRPKVEHHLHKAHVRQIPVVAQQLHTLGLHEVAAETAKLGFGIVRPKRTDEMGGVQIAGGFAGYEEIAHER